MQAAHKHAQTAVQGNSTFLLDAMSAFRTLTEAGMLCACAALGLPLHVYTLHKGACQLGHSHAGSWPTTWNAGLVYPSQTLMLQLACMHGLW